MIINNKPGIFQTLGRYTFLSTLLLGTSVASRAETNDELWQALTGGKIDFSLRYRYEHVDDDLRPDEGKASTVRTTLGYKTGDFFDLIHAYIQFEDVTSIFEDDYDDGTTRNTKTNFAVIPDPTGTEVNQAFFGVKAPASTLIKTGRQIITPRAAPFHRFLGTVLWRQNWQTHDAITFTNTHFKDTTLLYGYLWNTNRIFGDDAPDPRGNFDQDSHIFNIQNTTFKYANLEGYYYNLEMDNSALNSSETFGGRINGAIPFPSMETVKIVYAGEYATQSDTGENPVSYDADYYLAEGGLKFSFDGPINSVLLKASYEVLESDNGTFAFRTPLATGHAYQGWADRFLTTPADGIEDTYFTMVATGFNGTKLIVSYHDIDSDNLDYEYGDEIDVWLTKTFMKHYTVGLKYSDYSADDNTTLTTRNVGGVTADVSKFWGYFVVKF